MSEQPVSARVDAAFLVAPEQDNESTLAALMARRQVLFESADSSRSWPVATPVLAVLAPAMGATNSVVEYPGDPIALYAALSRNIATYLRVRHTAAEARSPWHDVVPDWRDLPSSNYHATVSEAGMRTPTDRPPVNSDELVFDPRVWDTQAAEKLRRVLETLQPRLVLISAVSPAHRYALEISRLVRATLPRAYIILGGRHADETMRWSSPLNELQLDSSSTLAVHQHHPELVAIDAVVSGDGAPLLDMLSTAACATISDENGWCKPVEVEARLHALAQFMPREGSGVIALVGASPVVFPVVGSRFQAPSTVYGPFAIRSRFDVFPADNGGCRRTAHMMTAATCPFQCTFCSESSATVHGAPRLRKDDIDKVIAAMADLVSLGADAVFFDDPVLWSGQWTVIEEFVSRLSRSRLISDKLLIEELPVLNTSELRRRWRDLQWGGQLTVDVVLDPRPEIRVDSILKQLPAAGCTYIYIGIESMADEVMQHVRKNLRRDNRKWPLKVREALTKLSDAGVPVGSSVLFGLDGETRRTMEVTIERIGDLIDSGLLKIASPNILTYHPATAIRRSHGIQELDFHSPMQARPPYTHFEEAYEGVVSKLLTEDDIWFIHESARNRWGSTRNPARPTEGEWRH